MDWVSLVVLCIACYLAGALTIVMFIVQDWSGDRFD